MAHFCEARKALGKAESYISLLHGPFEGTGACEQGGSGDLFWGAIPRQHALPSHALCKRPSPFFFSLLI